MRDFTKIDYRSVQAGYWVLTVDGVDTPVVAVRQGRNWVVQSPSTKRDAVMEVQHGRARNLRDAKSLMNFAWLHLDALRELDHDDALELELARLNVLARELKLTYPIFDQATGIVFRVSFVRALIETELDRRGLEVKYGPRV
jgi:hypothetical protein